MRFRPSPREALVLAVLAGVTTWLHAAEFLGAWAPLPLLRDLWTLTALGLALPLAAVRISRWWAFILLYAQPATWLWAAGALYAGDDIRHGERTFDVDAPAGCHIDRTTRLYFRGGGTLCDYECETLFALQDARADAAWLIVALLGPPPGSYMGTLPTEMQAIDLAKGAKPVGLTVDEVAARFASPLNAKGVFEKGEAWRLTGGAKVPLATAAVGDEGLLLSWDDGATLDLYDRHSAVLVDTWSPVTTSSGTTPPAPPDRSRVGEIPGFAKGARAKEGSDANALWLRRRWLHEPRSDAEIADLAHGLDAHGITTIYPFIGPMLPPSAPGHAHPGEPARFGWRDGDTLRPYDPRTARAFFDRAHKAAPALKILPWTGGVLDTDVHLDDPAWRASFVASAVALVELGADGVHLNIEPMPEARLGDDYLALLDALHAGFVAANHPNALVSVAAYPPTTPLHPYPDVHWSDAFLTNVCAHADDVSVMAYDTAQTTPEAYSALVRTWTTELATDFVQPPPGLDEAVAGVTGEKPAADLPNARCTWRVGVPDYDDDKPWHRPEAETLAAALQAYNAAKHAFPSSASLLSTLLVKPPAGLALYASWTTDSQEWALFDTVGRGVGPGNTDILETAE